MSKPINVIATRLNAAVLASVLVFCQGCSVNPATGERQLTLVSENAEIQMGREADPQIVATMGLVSDQGLQNYVNQIGQRMAALSERPDLPWSFKVVDDPIVNAFALPGGFIYLSRGILAHFTSEAQMASVLGHEIGHVTARHSVEQMSRAQLAQVGLIAGTILAPDLQNVFGAAGGALGLLFLKFGRDDERQSDDLGLRYMVRAGYDPRPMPDVFAMLSRVTAAAGGGGTPEWLSTHPDPENREERITAAINQLNENFDNQIVNRNEYLDRLDGMVYGANPRNGYFRENLFLHPDLTFQITFPAGWQTANQTQAVLAGSPEQDAIIQLTVVPDAGTPNAAAQAFFTQEGITGSGGATSINGLSAVAGDFQATTQQGELAGGVVFVRHGNNVFQILGYAGSQNWSQRRNSVQTSLTSFARLTDSEALNVQPNRLDVVTTDRGMTLRAFATEYPSVVSVEELALINQMNVNDVLPAGTKVKRVVQ
jgi:predicted Zn-dependent protease